MPVMKTESEFLQVMDDYACPIPHHMWNGLVGYLVHHRPTGGFLRAVLSNDLYGALSKADTNNARVLWHYPIWLGTYAPSESFGSAEAYEAWMAQKDEPEQEITEG